MAGYLRRDRLAVLAGVAAPLADIGELRQRGNPAGPAEVGDPLDAAQLPGRPLLDLSMLMEPPLDLSLDQRPQTSQVDQPWPVRRGGHRAPLEELRLAAVLDGPVGVPDRSVSMAMSTLGR
jgi:hypothetical protein